MTTLPVRLQNLTDREACIDTALRFSQGLDQASEELLNSAWLDDATFDPTGLSVIGRSYRPLSRRENIVPFLIGHVGALDTLHMLSNFRIELGHDTAELTCNSLAQHHRRGEGSQPDKMGCLMGNLLYMELRRTEEFWKILKLELRNGWCQGDLTVMDH